MSVPYEEALSSLQAMFSCFDKDLIGSILQQNKGHMEKTIDTLLEMSGEVPINENTDSDHSIAQMHQDEMLARMLQNEMIVNDNREDERIARLLHQKQLEQMQRQRELQQEQQRMSRPQNRVMVGGLPTHNYEVSHSSDEEEEEEEGGSVLAMLEEDLNLKEIKEKINNLGEAAKSKFKDLSDYFMKKDESNKSYEPVRTHDIEGDEEEEERGVNMVRRGNIQDGGNTSINSSEDEYESFVLEDRSSRIGEHNNNSSGGVRLRTLRESIGSKKDD